MNTAQQEINATQGNYDLYLQKNITLKKGKIVTLKKQDKEEVTNQATLHGVAGLLK